MILSRIKFGTKSPSHGYLHAVILFTHTITPRLRYIAEFIGKQISGQLIGLTSNDTYFREYRGARINYSDAKIADEEFWIKPCALLFEKNIYLQKIDCFDWKDQKAFFGTSGDFAFDIFAASFYLLSRYEEYLPHQKDMYGRYDHKNSLAYREGFLNQPLVNNWLEEFKAELKKKFPSFIIDHSPFTFLPTYDIDMAWSYRRKGFLRTGGGILRSLLKGNWQELTERIAVLKGKRKDPYDAYDWLNQLHEKYRMKPYYFFLVADRVSRYDKNISPDLKSMKDLIYEHAVHYPIGVHPSWRSGDDHSLLKKEIRTLTAVTGTPVRFSRQHYIRFSLPDTFRHLIGNGIQFDFSMGYGSINGFRASAASPFYWYDLENDEQTKLLLFPYCFMEATSFYDQKNTAIQALDEMRQYYQAVKAVNGTFIMIWHNSFLGTDRSVRGWRDVYEEFIKEAGNQNFKC